MRSAFARRASARNQDARQTASKGPPRRAKGGRAGRRSLLRRGRGGGRGGGAGGGLHVEDLFEGAPSAAVGRVQRQVGGGGARGYDACGGRGVQEVGALGQGDPDQLSRWQVQVWSGAAPAEGRLIDKGLGTRVCGRKPAALCGSRRQS